LLALLPLRITSSLLRCILSLAHFDGSECFVLSPRLARCEVLIEPDDRGSCVAPGALDASTHSPSIAVRSALCADPHTTATQRTALTKLDALQSELFVDSFTPGRSVLTVEERSAAHATTDDASPVLGYPA
jgi:hypothetical protein